MYESFNKSKVMNLSEYIRIFVKICKFVANK